MDRYCVIGHPVAHSKSPRIHALFAAQTGQDLVYDRLEAPLDGFAATVQGLRAGGVRGCNVTLPFKEQAYTLADETSARADAAQAANTLLFDSDGRVRADNTDGVGLVRDLGANLGVNLRGTRLLLLGAGGAARGVLGPLLEAGAHVTVSNRTFERARALVAGTAPGAARALPLDALAGGIYDIVINATSAGLSGALPELPDGLIAAGGGAYDLIYGPGAQPFLEWAWRQGAAWTADGLGMLVEQAAESFALWRGVRPATAPVIAALRAA